MANVFQIPKVHTTDVPVDIDLNSDGHLANVSCVPAKFSNDTALVSNEMIDGTDAFCVSFNAETNGVLGSLFKNCITADGKLISVGPSGYKFSPAMSEEGKTRMATLIAQSYDCYRLHTEQTPLAAQMRDVALRGNTADIGALSAAMRDSAPLIMLGIIPVDIDQSGAYPPAVGAVTAAASMVNDYIIINEPGLEENSGMLQFCMEMDSELKAPYGEGACVCMLENGEVSVESSTTVDFNKARLIENMATAFNQYFNGSSDFAQEVVAKASLIEMPERTVAKSDAIEEQGFWDLVIGTWSRQAEACADSPFACP